MNFLNEKRPLITGIGDSAGIQAIFFFFPYNLDLEVLSVCRVPRPDFSLTAAVFLLAVLDHVFRNQILQFSVESSEPEFPFAFNIPSCDVHPVSPLNLIVGYVPFPCYYTGIKQELNACSCQINIVFVPSFLKTPGRQGKLKEEKEEIPCRSVVLI